MALFFSQLSFAGSGETYRDIIEKAYNLSLQKDRAQATSILIGALKKESKKSSTAQKEISAALDRVSKVFYSDKAQQLYELALSLKSTDPAAAVSKLQEASRLEPDNVSVELALGRQALATGDCASAAARLNKQKDLLFAIEELRLLAAQTALCQGKLDEYQTYRNPQDLKKSPLSTFWQSAEAEYLMKTGAFAKTQELAQNLQKADPSFPEAAYWNWKAESELKMKSDRSAQKYLSLCKALNNRQLREYLAEPQLCRRTTDVETFLKKTNNPEI